MNRFDRRDAQSMLLCVGCLAAFPISIALTRPRPLAANSKAEMTSLIGDKRRVQISDTMRQRYEAASLNSDGPDTSNDPKVRWRTLREYMVRAGAEPLVATKVTAAAAAQLGDAWPCFIESGYLKDRPVWIVASSTPDGSGSYGYFCGNTTVKEILQMKTNWFVSKLQVVIFDAEPPYATLN